MSKINSKQKGKKGELEFSHLLKKHGFEARRGQQYSGTETTADIISELDRLHFEVKRVERLNIDNAIEQAVKDCGDKIPVVAHRKNRKDWLITMKFDDWIELIKKVYK